MKSGIAKKVVDLLDQYGTRVNALWAPAVAKPFDDTTSDIIKKNADALSTLTAAQQRSQTALDALPNV